jgi:hypothetical protein
MFKDESIIGAEKEVSSMIMKITLQLLIVLTTAFGSSIDTIRIEPERFGNAFYFKDRQVRSRSDMKYLLIWSPTAYRDFKGAQPVYIAKMASLTAGATLIGFSLVQGTFAVFSKAPFYWQPGAIGLGGIALSVPLNFWYANKITKAVGHYNRDAINKAAVRGKRRP